MIDRKFRSDLEERLKIDWARQIAKIECNETQIFPKGNMKCINTEGRGVASADHSPA